jgi:circadian clock protein KaiC
MGLDIAAAEQRGDVELLWYPTGEHILDELAHRLLQAVRRRGVKRLVIDGISGFQQAALEPERIVRFWSALCAELRALDVTALHTMELPEFIGRSCGCRSAASRQWPTRCSLCVMSRSSRDCSG